MKMSTRALCRIFGITLITWSIAIHTVSGVPVAVPHPDNIRSIENLTENTFILEENVTTSKTPVTSVSVNDGYTTTQFTDGSKDVNAANTTSGFAARALITTVPTSEYIELTNLENITKVLKISSNGLSTQAIVPKDNVNNEHHEKNNQISKLSNIKEKSTPANIQTKITMSSFLNETTKLSNDTKNSKPDIVSVLDNVVNYDSLLTNFMNETNTTNMAEQPSTTPETTSTPITSQWNKYNTIVRKRSTKTISEITTVVTTTVVPITTAETNFTTTTDAKNTTEMSHNLRKAENKENGTGEILKENASTWNRTTYSHTVTDATQAKEGVENVTIPMTTTTDESQVLHDEGELGVLESKRSGYLDNSKWAKEIYITTSSPESTTFVEIETENGNLNNGFKINSTAMSRQQMIEDALIEEHLRESKSRANQQTTTDASTTEGYTKTDITNSKQNASINPLLYKVNSNYKPLKKLEVQPHKSFTIDPDDNSWRNESINSRGIVYKPKNSSKPFTQVLKNKTESEWHNLQDKEFKDEEVELKERLEKIAAIRKSKKKLSEEVNTNEALSSSEMQQEDNIQSTTPYLPVFNQILFTTDTPIDETSKTSQATDKNQYDGNAILTEKPMEHLNNADAYDSYDEDDRFITMTEFDLMKTTPTTPRIKTPAYPQRAYIHTEKTIIPHYTTHYPPNRKGTIEYFPPKTAKVNFNNYDFQFKDKVNTFTTDFIKNRIEPLTVLTTTPRVQRKDKKVYEPSVYIMPPYETKLGDIEDSGYVIRHYKDFVSKAAAEAQHPLGALGEPSPHIAAVHKFVDSFNRNSDKLKEEFPILYNSNIVHRGGDDGRIVASSSAYLRRLHNSPPPSIFARTNKYDPTCINHTVELSPAYELHYFVNDEEQKQPPILDPPLYSDFA